MRRLQSMVRSISFCLLLLYPLLFPLGLIPQLDTAFTYLLEQLDIHVFGGSGSAGLVSVAFSLFRNVFVVSATFWFCYTAVKVGSPRDLRCSLFWGVYLPSCYLLSRLPSDFHLYTALLPSRAQCALWRSRAHTCLLRLFHSCATVFAPKKLNQPRLRSVHALSHGLCLASHKLDGKSPVHSAWRYLLHFLPETNKKCSLRTAPIVANRTVPALPNRASTDPMHAATAASSGRRCISSPALLNEFLDPTSSSSGAKFILRATSTELIPELHQRGTTSSKTPPVFNSLKPLKMIPDTKNLVSRSNSPVSAQPDKLPCGRRFKSIPCGSHERHSQQSSVQVVPEETEMTTKLAFHQRGRTAQSTSTGSELSTAWKENKIPQHQNDPLPKLMCDAMLRRLENDLICCCASGLAIFAFHCSPLLDIAMYQPYICRITIWTTVLCGAFLHYVVPNLRKSYPWLCLGHPAITTDPGGELVKWETGYVWFCWVERNILLPVITVVTVTSAMAPLRSKFGLHWATIIILITSMKMLRNGFSAAGRVFLTLFFTELFFIFDFNYASEAFPLNYFLMSILVPRFIELVLKLHFVYIYTAPFRITWGSVTHALVQIASIPHMLFVLANCFLSTVLSSPLEPLLASAVFITSYARPIKFWEVTHQTERMETTNTALAAQMHGLSEKHVMLNLNAIFYERLTRSLQLALAGDIQLGRLGGLTISHGDVFILGSEDLNFVIHIIEVGNGIVSFQLRGLEFMGTYCHEHETEALRSSTHNDNGCCCCNPGHLPGMLSLNAALLMRCITWQFVSSSYSVDGYRMTNHSADTIVRLNDLRRILVNRFIQCIIYYVSLLPELPKRLEHLAPYLNSNNFSEASHFDLDPVFLKSIDEDFDEQFNGVTRHRFVQIYSAWIRYCVSRKHEYQSTVSCDPESPMVTLCYALCLLGRRCMGGTQVANYDVDQVLRGIHDVFKGDIKVMTKDEWVLVDLDLLQSVVTPAMRVALKLYQDYFLWASDFAHSALYRKIVHTERNFVICHETDPTWRFAILNDAPSLFSIRWVGANTDDMYRFIQLTKSKLQFCAVKINPECVRGLWAGQQREQIFVRNTNPERGSIQGAQHVLRNLVNSSCDPPIGYPIYVSPILTSFTGTSTQFSQVAGPELSFRNLAYFIRLAFRRIYSRFCRGTHPSPSTDIPENAVEVTQRSRLGSAQNTPQSRKKRLSAGRDHQLSALTNELDAYRWPIFTDSSESVRLEIEKCHHSAHLTTLCALVHNHGDSSVPPRDTGTASSTRRVRIVDPKQILNSHTNKLTWPSDEWRLKCLPQSACLSSVFPGIEGQCLHRWTPSNPNPAARSFCHRTIALIAFPGGPPLLDGHYIAIWEDEGLQDTSQTVDCTHVSPMSRDLFAVNETASEYSPLNSPISAPSAATFDS
ncbi:unnamed protein product [Dicrocoelium dendriticum]|nr:unnamed protein product [Dicrocoelium dendriticum]